MAKVVVERDDSGLVTLTLNDPAKLNALDAAMTRELLAAVEDLTSNPTGVRCLLVTGAGRGFCAGGSLSLMTPGGESSAGITLGTHHHRVMTLLRDLPFPLVTAVNGPAAGLGFSYALAGDLVLASQSAFFAAAFAKIGVSPDGGLSWMLPRLVGWARAKEVLLLGQRIASDEALRLGLVNRLFDDSQFHEQARAVALDLAQGPTLALAATRKLLWEAWDNTHAVHLDREEALQGPVFASADAREGPLAMVEKRTPQFSGR